MRSLIAILAPLAREGAATAILRDPGDTGRLPEFRDALFRRPAEVPVTT